MCQPAYCPCSKKVDKNSFYYKDRQRLGDFGGLKTDLETEGASEFYRDCYVPLLNNGKIEKLNEDFLKLLKEIE